MPEITIQEIIDRKLPFCERCREVLESNGGSVIVSASDFHESVKPVMWKHSELDVYHAWVLVGERHVFLCGTDEFDEISLKRLRPLKREEIDTWNVYIHGAMYTVVEGDDNNYEILNEEGTIVKNEEIEARIFNHMMHIRTE